MLFNSATNTRFAESIADTMIRMNSVLFLCAWVSRTICKLEPKKKTCKHRLTGTKGSLNIHNAMDMAWRVGVRNPAQGFPITGLGS